MTNENENFSAEQAEQGSSLSDDTAAMDKAQTASDAVITDKSDGNPFGMEIKKAVTKKAPSTVWKKLLSVLNYIFIDGLSGMALGLFATLIIGTIISTIGGYIPGKIGEYITAMGSFAKMLMGAGIGVGMAYKLKKAPMVSISAGVAGSIGAYASKILSGVVTITGVGEPLGAFVAAFVAIEVGSLVSGKTKVDIIVTPLVGIVSGATIGLLVGPPISSFMTAVGALINSAASQQPVLMGILVAVLMGIALTLPISSAAIGVSLGLSGIAAGAAVVGCCCQMVGFAVMSFRENKWSGLIAQGVGTSMLQMPNIIRRPIVWLPPIIASAILGPIASAAFGMTATKIGAGMGTSGLVGCIDTFTAMTAAGVSPWLTLLEIALMHVILPAGLCLGISELMRRLKLIKEGDLKLDL